MASSDRLQRWSIGKAHVLVSSIYTGFGYYNLSSTKNHNGIADGVNGSQTPDTKTDYNVTS